MRRAPALVQDKKPNIVFILTDNLGYGEIGAHGGGIARGTPTPNIDSLAKDGTQLLNMNMETQCTPNRMILGLPRAFLVFLPLFGYLSANIA